VGEMFQSAHFGLEVSPAKSRKAVGLFAAGVVLLAEAFNPAILKQAAQGPVERAGAETDAAAADLPSVLKNGVTVARTVGQAK